ncbi:MAG TPA: DEAD/DEAH box helicase, partial [Rhizobiales bacterium]|nr:DEAD/DEAH box helicase [Hyphomicrobiales bacterium]
MQPSDLKLETGNKSFAGAPEGLDGLVLADVARANPQTCIVHIARDEHRMAAMAEALSFFAPDVDLLEFPAWDCLPYDRVSPAPGIMAKRLSVLSLLMGQREAENPLIVLTTVNAALQKIPPRQIIAKSGFSAKPGQNVSMDDLQAHLQHNGFTRTGTVVDRGDYAVRGGIIDIYPSGSENPVRLDFFGDTLESIREFDVETQRTTKQLKLLNLNPANEVILNDETIARFRTAYKSRFGGDASQDPLYEAISSARRYQGMEHWLPLFYGEMATLFDYTGNSIAVLDHLSREAIVSRNEQLEDYYKARKKTDSEGTFGSAPYNPLEIGELYLDDANWAELISQYPLANLSPFDVPEQTGVEIVHAGGKQGRSFAAERSLRDANIYELVAKHLAMLVQSGKRVVVAAWSEGARDRLETILKDHGVSPIASAKSWAQVQNRDREIISTVVLGVESGFESDDLAVVAEQDILGDRMVRRTRKTRRAADFIAELSSLEAGDLVVHVDHGIGKFEGLKTIDIAGAPRDCLHLTYLGGDRLFLPVENIELLSRYGNEDAGVRLDKLGGGAWQARKAKLKKRVRDIAASLIKTAAARELRKGAIFATPEGLYDEFAARFPFTETEDQLDAINAVLEDFQKGKPMDRLICGDVGFGKTEVAMRTAFVAVMAGKQVAIVVPTTLLARQHYAS